MDNRRRRTRVRFAGTVNLHALGMQIRDLALVDISAKGIMVGGEVPLEAGQECTVDIPLYSGSDEAPVLYMDGRVARITTGGAAIDFVAMDPETYLHLRNIVVLNAPDPEATEKEFASPAFDASIEADS